MDWNKLKPKNPIIFILIVVFVLINTVDGITAFFILPGESNPIFLLLDSVWGILLFKVLIISIVIFYGVRNIYPSHLMYYLIIVILVLGILTVGLASYSNIQGILNPKEVEKAANISDSVKLRAYFSFIRWFYYTPLVFCIITFVLYDRSHSKAVINPEYFKKKKWWKR